MRPLSSVIAAALLATTVPAFAQTAPTSPSPISRVDVTGTLGWFNANKSDLDSQSYNDWYSRSLHGGLLAGWYWTDNLKTEVEFGGSTRATVRTYRQVVINGQNASDFAAHDFSTRKLAVSQLYQGYRNQWVHPYIGVGVETTWERHAEDHSPIFWYDSAARVSRQVVPRRLVGPRTETTVRALATVGFKAYMTRRAFFRGDFRMAFRGGVDEVLLRCGFGVDF